MFQEKPKNWRKGQTIFNFLVWLNEEKDYAKNPSELKMADPFNIPNNELEELYQEFLDQYHTEKQE